MKKLTLVAVLAVLFGGASAGGQEVLEPQPQRIVNGVLTTEFPSVAYLAIQGADGLGSCSGTLIGCRTILTAAHCFCPETPGTSCNPNTSTVSLAYLQHGGVFGVSDVQVHPSWQPSTSDHDLTIVRLNQPVNGVAPTRINTVGRVAAGTQALIAGFGVTQGDATDDGIKRAGLVTTAACTAGNPATHLCWNFNLPLGAPGDDSNTCQGDSGGPLFVQDVQGNLVVAGVTSFGNPSCLPPDNAVDAEVFVDRAWIQSVGGADLNQTTCGNLPQAGTPEAPFLTGQGQLGNANPEDIWTFEVPANTARLRVSLNGENPLDNDFDLTISRGAPPNSSNVLCSSQNPISIEFCELLQPPADEWFAEVSQFSGSGEYQLTITTFAGQSSSGPCVPGPTTMCLGQNNRFKLEVDWRNQQGNTGPGTVVDAESTDSGIFTFFDPNNWELMVKVLNTCAFSNRIWVFFSATTNQEFTLRVTDTERGVTKTYFNPLGQVAETTLDVNAFATCP